MDNLYNFKAARKRGQSSFFSTHQLTRYKELNRYVFVFKKGGALPFIRCDWIDQNVTVDIYGVRLWEDGVLILSRQKQSRD